MEGQARNIGLAGIAREGVGKNPPDICQGLFQAIERNSGSVQNIKAAQVIQPQDVVHVVMGKNYRIYPHDTGAEHLLAIVDGGVDQDMNPVEINKYRSAQAFIPGIGGTAHPALAADHRDADGGSAA